MATPVGIAEYLKAIYNNVPLVFAAGGGAWKKEFWNNYQTKGLRVNYEDAFSGKGWTKEFFTPIYELHPTESAANMFSGSLMAIDLTTHLSDLGIEFRTLHSTNISGMFYDTCFIRVPKITLGGTLTEPVWHLFSESKELITIDEIEISTDFEESNTEAIWNQCFERCAALKNLVFSGEGKIKDSIDLQWSTLLTKASITSVINALSGNTSALICRLSLQAVNAAFETAANALDGSTSEEWQTLIETKPNWSVALL